MIEHVYKRGGTRKVKVKFRQTLLVAAIGASPMAAQAANCVNGPNATGTCTVPVGVTSMTVHLIGGGGGGANRDGISGGGGGGGGGSYCGGTFTVNPGGTLTIARGAGGAGAIPPIPFQSGNPGGDGDPSTISGAGLPSGLGAAGGKGGIGTNTDGGAGGDASLCTASGAVARLGGAGGNGILEPTVGDGGGGGGGAAGSAANGTNGQNGLSDPGVGGAGGPGGAGSPAGGDGGDGGGQDLDGAPGPAAGGGGGGAGEDTTVGTDTDRSGGDGADGVVVLAFKPVAPPTPIPAIGPLGLLLSALGIGVVGAWRRRRGD